MARFFIKKFHSRPGFTLLESLVAVSLFVVTITSAVGLFLAYSQSQRDTSVRQELLNQVGFAVEKMAQEIRLKKILLDQPTVSAPHKTSGQLYSSDGDNGISGKEYELGLQDANGDKTVYFFETSTPSNVNCTTYGYGTALKAKVLYKYRSAEAICEPILNVSNITISDVGFYISPNYNPYPTSNSDCKTVNGGNNFGYNGYYCTCKQDSDCYSNNCSEDNPASTLATGYCLNSQPIVTLFVKVQIGTNINDYAIIQTTVSNRQYN